MIPGIRHPSTGWAGIPRESGDDPFLVLFVKHRGEYSPRERG